MTEKQASKIAAELSREEKLRVIGFIHGMKSRSKNVNRQLQKKMQQKGYTQRSLSAEMGMNKNTLNAKVNGKRPFTAKEIESACKALEIKGAAEVCAIFLPWVEGE